MNKKNIRSINFRLQGIYSGKYTSDRKLYVQKGAGLIPGGGLLSENDSERVFNELATFESILNYYPFYNADDIPLPEPPKEYICGKAANLKFEKQVLETIRDYPEILTKPTRNFKDSWMGPTDILIHYLKEANSRNKEIRDKAKNVLVDRLVPKHLTRKKPVPKKEELTLVKDVIVKLAKHLSERCHNEATNGEYTLSKGDFEYDYDELIKWARTHEDRIVNLPSDSLKKLIFNTSEFAENLIARHFDITPKTLFTRNK